MNTLRRGVLVIVISLGAAAAAAQNGVVLEVPEHPVWCSDVDVASNQTKDARTYSEQLEKAVKAVDDALGGGASTGAPFAAKSVQKKPGAQPNAASGSAESEILIVTVCVAVSPLLKPPTAAGVYADKRPAEKVFAQACALTDASCADALRNQLRTLLGTDPLEAEVRNLFSRSVPIKAATADATEMKRVLFATDLRLVTMAPPIDTTGDLIAAANLTLPEQQQKPRGLLRKTPSDITVHPPAKDQGLVVAISLTPEIAAVLEKPKQ